MKKKENILHRAGATAAMLTGLTFMLRAEILPELGDFQRLLVMLVSMISVYFVVKLTEQLISGFIKNKDEIATP